MSTVETTIRNSLTEIARVASLVEELASAQALPAASVWPLNVALDEVLSNIINYGHTDADAHEIQVRVSLEHGLVVAEVEDDGQPFDPLAAPAPTFDAPLEERPIGGLGIHIVRNLMTEVSYARIAGRNRLTMKRLIAQEPGGKRMDLNERVINGVTVLEVAGRIDSMTAPDFETRLGSALDAAQRRLVLDFGQLLYISSAGFRVLYRAVKHANEGNGKLVLCSMSATVSELFAIAGFNKLFTIVGSREDGVMAIGS